MFSVWNYFYLESITYTNIFTNHYQKLKIRRWDLATTRKLVYPTSKKVRNVSQPLQINLENKDKRANLETGIQAETNRRPLNATKQLSALPFELMDPSKYNDILRHDNNIVNPNSDRDSWQFWPLFSFICNTKFHHFTRIDFYDELMSNLCYRWVPYVFKTNERVEVWYQKC